MPEFFTFFFFVWIFITLICIVIRFRPMPISGAMPIAFSAFVGLEGAILNFLSLFHLVKAGWVLISNFALLLLWYLYVITFKRSYFNRFKFRLFTILKCFISHPAFIFMSPFLIILLLTILFNAPNTWDSLTYHMSRVAHWIQNGSVDYYFTTNSRQNEMGPGAEYLILFFQILTNSDNLAGFIQFFSYLLLASGIYYMRRFNKSVDLAVILSISGRR